jgi:hypothetical protein
VVVALPVELRFRVGRRLVRLVAPLLAVDTGAWLSYVMPVRGATLPVTGRARDFNPILGALNVEPRRTIVPLRDRTFEAEVGVAPPLLGAVLAMARVAALVGTDLLSRGGETVLHV